MSLRRDEVLSLYAFKRDWKALEAACGVSAVVEDVFLLAAAEDFGGAIATALSRMQACDAVDV